MISVRYAVCSERQGKPVLRALAEARAEAELTLEEVRKNDLGNLEPSYWIAELGAEADAWWSLLDEHP